MYDFRVLSYGYPMGMLWVSYGEVRFRSGCGLVPVWFRSGFCDGSGSEGTSSRLNFITKGGDYGVITGWLRGDYRVVKHTSA